MNGMRVFRLPKALLQLALPAAAAWAVDQGRLVSHT